MKKLLIIFTGVFFMLSGAAFAQSSDTATGTARSGIIVPLTLTTGGGLRFGTLLVPTQTTVFRRGNQTTTGTLSGDEVHVGSYFHGYNMINYLGSPGQVTVEIQPTTTISNGADTLPVSLFLQPNSTTSATILGTSTTDNILTTKRGLVVGGDITLLPTTKPGTYTGTYTMTVSYI